MFYLVFIFKVFSWILFLNYYFSSGNLKNWSTGGLRGIESHDKRFTLIYECETHLLARIYTVFMYSKSNYIKSSYLESWSSLQLRGSVINFQDPVTNISFSPAMNGHEFPIFKSFHGMVKKPWERAIKHCFVCCLKSSEGQSRPWSMTSLYPSHVQFSTGDCLHPRHHPISRPKYTHTQNYWETGMGLACSNKSGRDNDVGIREPRLKLYPQAW